MNYVQVKNLKEVVPVKTPLRGTVVIPADKSISHRAAIFGSLTYGTVCIANFSGGADCKSTLNVLKGLGVEIDYKSEKGIIISNKNKFREPDNIIDAGNSGTTIRLMAGVLSGLDFYSVLTGDDSLRKRPMARVIVPLKKMGANIWAKDNDTKAPISIKGSRLSGITYNSPIASAQVKSAILLAGLSADGTTIVTEPSKSRDHTERLLSYLDADISVNGNEVRIQRSSLTSKPITVPGDVSSAAFFMVAGAIVPDSEIIMQNVGLNSTRTGIIDVLKNMGAEIEILNQRLECGEEVGDIKVNYSDLKGITIEGDIIPRVIDELPIIAVAATQAEGTTIVRGAEDLRHKESDRIKAIYSELSKLGAKIEETEDGFIIHGKTKLKGNCILETYHDHRIAMSGYVAGLIADSPIQINEFNWVNISFPEFTEIFEKLRVV
ncbi:MAG: 3-phosphoshikimate 1-carboxyvinyltransferase [Candidatus Melainabacteria bacterium RIFOXYA12_FULL_32_12]|nr:MAG: 3-phosphoshikimate 1-carboxyvinyltransferase [Candidatus Melainabacteria bacterium RIFOXYA2_FULL_32_9]OGI29972.1 MAG: 3-phosphoshikimate 1-carboxyvinyltransferase [Candidatus Melainabacteria bacterium RIFOXYA12_FULL_32_12]